MSPPASRSPASRPPTLRDERPGDRDAVAALIAAAFAGRPYASGTEPLIHAAILQARAATLALVAEDAGRLVGQVLFSPLAVDGRPSRWHGLGPLAVAPNRQGAGIGSSLVAAGLARLRVRGSDGCLVLGDGGFYGRFGFRPPVRLRAPGLPAPFVFVPPFGEEPDGAVAFHPAFSA